jgi:hypothetical protein
MFIPSVLDASASTDSPASGSAGTSANTLTCAPPPPSHEQAPIRHLLFGSLSAVQSTIQILHKRGYAEPNDWSAPISTGRPNEVMAILTKRVRLER